MHVGVELLAQRLDLANPMAFQRLERSRSVRSTPSISALSAGSSVERAESGRLSWARRRLSAAPSMSRAKLVTA
jgi:hypothetical protein